MLSQARLLQLIERFSVARVAVIGDFFLDKYREIDPSLDEVSVETGLPAHQVVRKWNSPGAAGTVVNNLHGLGAGTLFAVGMIGDDGEGYELRRGLEQRGCNAEGLLGFEGILTPVYHKTMVLGKEGLDAETDRYDTKKRTPVDPEIEETLKQKIDELWDEVDAVILEDQVEDENCGVLTSEVRAHLIEHAKADEKKVILVDSRCRIELYQNMLIKPNEAECIRAIHTIEQATSPGEEFDDETIQNCGGDLNERTGKPVFVTRGKKGIQFFSKEKPVTVPAVAIPEPTDPTGAGDSTSAGIVMALAAGASMEEAALVGVLVGSITVQHLGTTGFATPDQLPARLGMWHDQQQDL